MMFLIQSWPKYASLLIYSEMSNGSLQENVAQSKVQSDVWRSWCEKHRKTQQQKKTKQNKTVKRMCFVTVHRLFHPSRYSGSARTSAISPGKLKTNKLRDKCPGSQMTALREVWKHFAKLAAPPRARHTGRLSAMGVVKWDRC